MYQRHAASSRGSAAIAAPAQRNAERVSPIARAASAATRRARRSSSRCSPRATSAQVAYGSSATAGPVDSSPIACSAAARATEAALASLRSAWSQYRAAMSRSTRTPGSPASRYPGRPPRMTPGPRAARSLLTSVATFCPAAAGGSPAHSTSTIRSTGTRPGRSTVSSFSSSRDLRLPTSPSESSVPSRVTPNVPARRSSMREGLAVLAGAPLPTRSSYR